MKAWLLDDAPGEYRWGDVELPTPGPGQVRVDVVSSALNHLDLWLRQGMPKPRLLPMVAGCDAAGRVGEVGPGVERWSVGDEVVVNPSFACGRCSECLADRSVFCARWGIMGEHYWGAHAQSVLVNEANLVNKPPQLSWEQAAAYPLCGLTAYRMLKRARLVAGETLLVVGAGGGVACAALTLGVAMGARVIATSRDPLKCKKAVDLGATDAFVTPPAGPVPGELRPGQASELPVKADVVVDSAGTATWAMSTRALRPGGRLVTCGGTAGAKVELSLPRLFFGHFEVIGSTMGTFEDFARLTDMVAAGLPVVVDSTYELERYPEALGRLASGAQFGKVVLRH